MEDNVTDGIGIGLKSAMRHAFGDDGVAAGLNVLLHASPNLSTLRRNQRRADAGFHVDEIAAGDHSTGARNYTVDLVEVRMGDARCGVHYFDISALNCGQT